MIMSEEGLTDEIISFANLIDFKECKEIVDFSIIHGDYIANNQLKEAWLTLNSKGWFLTDMTEGLEMLKTKTNDELFHLVANNWLQGWEKSTFKTSNY